MVRSFNVNGCEKHTCPVQLSRAREAELREEMVLLRQDRKELQSNICLLEEDNQVLREEIQHLRGKSCCVFFLICKECEATVGLYLAVILKQNTLYSE